MWMEEELEGFRGRHGTVNRMQNFPINLLHVLLILARHIYLNDSYLVFKDFSKVKCFQM